MVPVMAGFVVRRVAAAGTAVVLDAEGGAAEAICPDCGLASRRVHARYEKKAANHLGLLKVACILLWYRRARRQAG